MIVGIRELIFLVSSRAFITHKVVRVKHFMAFECQRDTEIGLKNTSPNRLDTSGTQKVSFDQLIPCRNKGLEPIWTNNQPHVLKSSVKSGVPLFETFSGTCLSFTDLPPGVIFEILNYLEPKELGVVSCVSTTLYYLASEHHVWKQFYYERWGQPITSAGSSNERSWKELFVEREFRSRSFMGRFSVETLFGHKEAVRTVFVLASKKLLFSSGYDQVIRMWDLEEGLSIMSSRPLGCTIRAVAADTRLLIVGGTDGFIHGWKAEDGNPHLFDLRAPNHNQNMEFRVWEHQGPITCLALDSSNMYSGSWDMTVRIWDRDSLRCLKILVHNDWVWSLVPHDSTLGSTAGSGVYIWDINSGNPLAINHSAHDGNTFALARSYTGKFLFTGGEDGSIHMFELTRTNKCSIRKIATWTPHVGSVYSLAFEFPWLVSASAEGRMSLIDIRKLLKIKKHSSSEKRLKGNCSDQKNVEPPQRMLHGFGSNLFSVSIGCDRIVCGGEEGVVRIWNFSQALEIEQRVRNLRGMRLENRMRRRKLQVEMGGKSSQGEQCSVAARKNQMNNEKNSWHNRRRVSGKMKL